MESTGRKGCSIRNEKCLSAGHSPYQQHQQVILLVAALDHVMQTVPLARMDDFRTGLLTYIETQDQALCRRIDESGQLSDEDRETILKLSREFLTRFQTEAAEKSGE